MPLQLIMKWVYAFDSFLLILVNTETIHVLCRNSALFYVSFDSIS